MNRQLTVVASDVTNQRTARWPIADHNMPCSAIVAQGVQALDLPTRQSTGEQVSYNAFSDGGDLLPGDNSVADIVQRYRIEAELRIRVIPELEGAQGG